MRRFFILLVAVSLVLAGVLTQSVRAASDWYVSTNGNDANDCRSVATACRRIGTAIERAASGDIVYVGAGVYTENLTITKDLALVGAGFETVIDGGGIDRVLKVLGGRVYIQHLTIRNGRILLMEGHDYDLSGGGILNEGMLSLTDTTVTGNKASKRGGGIYNLGELTVSNSTVSNNDVEDGSEGGCAGILNTSILRLSNSRVIDNRTWGAGGICNWANANAVISSSTISGNEAWDNDVGGIANDGNLEVIDSTISNNLGSSHAGGISNWKKATATVTNSTINANVTRGSDSDGGGGIANTGTLTLINSTVTSNVATEGSDGGGGIYAGGGNTTIRNTIIAGNRAEDGGQGPDCYGSLTTDGVNIIQNLAACIIQGGIVNVLSVDPKLGTLRDNGGPTRTHALLADSPAIDAATYTECPTTDQRGVERPLDGNGDLRAVCDIGAFEYSTVPSAPTMTPAPTVPPTQPTTAPTSCRTNTGSWQNTRIGSLTGSFTATFDATPHQANMDGVIGLSKGSANDYEDLAAIVRFNAQGFLDARNGAEYQATTAVPYTVGTSYHFRLVVRVPQHTYDIFVTPANGTEQVLGTNFVFRAEQAGVTALDTLAVDARVGSHTVCNFAVAGGTTPPTPQPGQTITPVPPGASPTPVPPGGTAVPPPASSLQYRVYLPLAVR